MFKLITFINYVKTFWRFNTCHTGFIITIVVHVFNIIYNYERNIFFFFNEGALSDLIQKHLLVYILHFYFLMLPILYSEQIINLGLIKSVVYMLNGKNFTITNIFKIKNITHTYLLQFLYIINIIILLILL